MVFSAPCTEYKSYIKLAREAHKKHEEEMLKQASVGSDLLTLGSTESTSTTLAPSSTPSSARMLYKTDVMDIINGSAAFAGGGGGSKQYGMLILEEALKLRKEIVKVCYQISIQDMEDEESVIPFAFMGKPTAIQKSPGMMSVLAIATIKAYEAFYKKGMKYVCGVEVGPTNSIAPMFVAAYQNSKGEDCYVLDADLQGRAVLSLSMLGPYMMGVPMKNCCFAYISADGNPIEGLKPLSKEPYEEDGKQWWVYGAVTPDHITTAAETEAFLGGVIGKARENSCLAVAFSPLQKGVLLDENYSSGVKAQIFTPNTLTRSRMMGERLRKEDDPYQMLADENAVFLHKGAISNIFFPSDGSARSDLGVYYISGTIASYAGVFNNETVMFGQVVNNNIIPILNAPSAITAQINKSVEYEAFSLERGECLTNDELTYIHAYQPFDLVSLPMNFFAMPPAPFLTTNEALAMIGPKSWGVPPSIKNFSIPPTDYIPIPSTYKAPNGEGLLQVNSFGKLVPFNPKGDVQQVEEPKVEQARDN